MVMAAERLEVVVARRSAVGVGMLVVPLEAEALVAALGAAGDVAVSQHRADLECGLELGGAPAFHGPTRAIRFALAVRDGARQLGIDIRAGAHTGEVELRGTDLGGIAVHIGQRISSLAGPGEVLLSSTVKELAAGSGIELDDRGSHSLEGVPDEWRVYAAS